MNNVVKGAPVSATHSIVYEPVLTSGGHIVTIKYKYNINIVVDNVMPYMTTVNHKIYSQQLLTDSDVHAFIGQQVLEIHQNSPAAKIVSIDVVSKF
jgi:hypothetical protein